MSAYIRLILISTSLVFAYANFKIFQSYRMQTEIIFDFNKQEFKSDNFKKLMNSDRNFPNLSATAFPLYALFAKYQIMFQDYNGAINTLTQNDNVNPYMRIKESLLAETYFNLGIRDSSYFYSKKAYENLPLNARHYQQYLKELTFRKDIDKINEVFFKSRAKHNPEYWLFYFSSVIRLKSENSPEIDNLARESLKRFPTNNKIKTIASYILIGEEKVRESYDLFKEGIIHFEKSQFNIASDKFISAYELNKIDYSFSENAGMSLIKEEKFEEAIKYLEISSNNSDKPDDGKSEFGLAISYMNLNQKDKACDYFKQSMQKNYKAAFGNFSSYCN